jgi:hypothetical protein
MVIAGCFEIVQGELGVKSKAEEFEKHMVCAEKE